MRMPVLSALLALALTLPASGVSLPLGAGYGAIDAPRRIDPIDLANLFCAARIASDMTPLRRYFAPRLTRLLAGTPPDTVPWQSFPDRPQDCTAKVINGFDDTAGVLVQITYYAGANQWSDTLNLQRTPDSWLLNNVFYQSGGNLRFRLFDARP